MHILLSYLVLFSCSSCLLHNLCIQCVCSSTKRIRYIYIIHFQESSNSWWKPKAMSYFNSGMQILKCQFQVLTRMFAGGFMIVAIAYLLSQRSGTQCQTMPVTLLVILLGVVCGLSGNLCIYTLGGDGGCWLILWWIFCSLHIFSNIWTSALYVILNGPIIVSEKMTKNDDPLVPYWCRRVLFYAIAALFLPVLCGLLPFASLSEWKDHFYSLIINKLKPVND